MRSRVLALLLAALATPAQAASLIPLDAEDAELLPTGKLEVVVGADGLYDYRPLFHRFERDQWGAPVFALNAGLGTRAEAQVRWEALSVEGDPDHPGDDYGTGDVRLFTKVKVLDQGAFGLGGVPATAVHFGVKFPNATRSKGLGTDETDVFASALFSEPLGGASVHANLGIGILGNPGPAGRQDDLFLYGLALVSPEVHWVPAVPLALFGEVAGWTGTRYRNDRSRGRVGLRLGGGALAGYVAASTGIDDRSEEFGVRAGILWSFRAFSE